MHFLRQSASAVLGALLLVGLITTTDASAQTVVRQVIGNGATMIHDGSGQLVLGGTVGQPVIGVSGYEPGSVTVYHGFWHSRVTSSVRTPDDAVAGERMLWNAPNPFITSTNLYFNIPNRSQVRLRVYDMDGKLVRSLVDATYSGGTHSVQWDARNNEGDQVATGVYYYTLDAQPMDQGGRAVTLQKQMVLMK